MLPTTHRPTFSARVRDALDRGLPLPLIRGGDGSTEGDAGDGGGDGNADEGGDGNNGDADLGDAGKRALERERQARRTAEARAREHEAAAARAAELEAELEELRGKNMSEQERLIAEAEARGRSAASAEAEERLKRAEVRAAAAGKLQDPNDAVTMLDLTKIKVGRDGAIDTEALSSAIDELLETKPYLAAARRGPSGDGDQGARAGGAGEVDPGAMSMSEFAEWRKKQFADS